MNGKKHFVRVICFFSKEMGPSGIVLNGLKKKHLHKTSTWVHAGIVCPQYFIDFNNNDKNTSFIVESLVSGFDGVNNVETNRFHNGLQIRNLQHVVEAKIKNGDAIACFHIKDSPFPYTLHEERNLDADYMEEYKNNHKFTEFIQIFWEKYSACTYDVCNCSKAININIFSSTQSKKRLFCSEAVVRFYQHIGIMDYEIDAEKISPEELGSWCGDILGQSPFISIPDVISKKMMDCCTIYSYYIQTYIMCRQSVLNNLEYAFEKNADKVVHGSE